jgi:hypothetical protein
LLVTQYGSSRKLGGPLLGQAMFGVVGGGPELVATFGGRAGSLGQRFQHFPLGLVAGVVYEAQQTVEVAAVEEVV